MHGKIMTKINKTQLPMLSYLLNGESLFNGETAAISGAAGFPKPAKPLGRKMQYTS